MITHPEKVLFPDDGITKGDLAAYYESIAPLLLPHIRGRPVTMERFPAGIGQKGFIQKDVSKGFPDWLERVEVPKKGGTVHHALITDTRSLLWVVNQNTITPHVWTSRVPKLYQPDICVFDLDPANEDEPKVLRAAALALRDLLQERGHASWIKTSGSKGFHIVVPMDGKIGKGAAARFANRIGRELVERDPKHLTQEFSKVDRRGHLRGYGPEWLQRDICGGVCRAAQARRAGVGPVHVGRGRSRRGGSAEFHAEEHGNARGGSWRPLGGASAPGQR